MAIESTGPNAEQISHWNGTFGQRWVELQEMLDAQIEPLGRTAQERARISQGEHVLDVGCGCGQSSLQIAKRVGTSGHVLGVDLSEPMLARAIERGRVSSRLRSSMPTPSSSNSEQATSISCIRASG